MSLFDDVEAAARAQRPGIKARAMAALANLDGQAFTRGAFTVTVLSPRIVGEDLELSLRVVRTSTGRDVTPVDLNPIRIVNPPILVPDPAGAITRTFLDDQGLLQTLTYRADPRSALVETLRGVVR